MVLKTIKLCPSGHIVRQKGKHKEIRENVHYVDSICNDIFNESQVTSTNVVKGNESYKALKYFRN